MPPDPESSASGACNLEKGVERFRYCLSQSNIEPIHGLVLMDMNRLYLALPAGVPRVTTLSSRVVPPKRPFPTCLARVDYAL